MGERETMPVAGSVFVHRTFLGELAAYCITERPATRCDCGMYAIRWLAYAPLFSE